MNNTILTKYIHYNQTLNLSCKKEFIQPNQTLNLSCKKEFIQANLAFIVDFLKSNQTITRLDLSFNYIGSENTFPMESLAEIITHNSTIQSIILRMNDLTIEQMELLADAIENNTSLKSIYLNNNYSIGDEGIQILARGLRNNRSIDTLDLTTCDITSNGIIELSRVLKQREIVTKLKLHDYITDDGIIELASAPLSKLEIFSERITNECLLPLVSNPLIEYLSVSSNNNFTDDGILQIRDSLKYNTSLRYLYLGCESTRFSEIGKLALLEVLDYNLTIEDIYIMWDFKKDIFRKLSKNFNKRISQKSIYLSLLTHYQNTLEQYILNEDTLNENTMDIDTLIENVQGESTADESTLDENTLDENTSDENTVTNVIPLMLQEMLSTLPN